MAQTKKKLNKILLFVLSFCYRTQFELILSNHRLQKKIRQQTNKKNKIKKKMKNYRCLPNINTNNVTCGIGCNETWLDQSLWCDNNCITLHILNETQIINNNTYNYNDTYDCPYQNQACIECTGGCLDLKYVWDELINANQNYMTGYEMINNLQTKNQIWLQYAIANHLLIDFNYNNSNISYALLEWAEYTLNQSLYVRNNNNNNNNNISIDMNSHLNPYMFLNVFAWNIDSIKLKVTKDRALQISCNQCFGSTWNQSV